MSSEQLPSPRTDLLERPIGSELALFDVEKGIVHTLNPSATVVWRVLRTSAEQKDLVEALQEAFGIEGGEAERGVEDALGQFRELDLVVEQ